MSQQGLQEEELKKLIYANKRTKSIDCRLGGEIHEPIRNTCCTKSECVWNMDTIVQIILEEQQKNNPGFQSFKCTICSNHLIRDQFYVDLDMLQALQSLRTHYSDKLLELIYTPDDWKVYTTLKNEWILEGEGQTFTIKEPDPEMYSEYERNYPQFESKQTPEFYVNGYVFIHENLNVKKNGKLQSVIFLFFPSLANHTNKSKHWKEVHVYKQNNEQQFFNLYMSACKVFNSQTGQHSIFASGGLGYPEKKDYTNRSFMVPLFIDDPEAQLQQEVVQIDTPQMLQPRVFHQLVCLKNKVYALGGYIRDKQKDIDMPLKTCESYDLIQRRWERVSDMGTARQLFTATVFNEQIFVIGGKVQDPSTRQDYEDLTMEIFDPQVAKWVSYSLFQQPHPQKYFTERAYCFVKQDMNLVVFGGRKEKQGFDLKVCSRSKQAVELNLNTGKHIFSEDHIPDPPIGFEGPSDFGGIYFNGRFIFGFKQVLKDKSQEFFCPSICKYLTTASSNKFSVERFKKIDI